MLEHDVERDATELERLLELLRCEFAIVEDRKPECRCYCRLVARRSTRSFLSFWIWLQGADLTFRKKKLISVCHIQDDLELY